MNNVIAVDEVQYQEPRSTSLPAWVKAKAATRGYGDALEPLSLFVTQADIDAAFDCAAQGDGSRCVMAQSGRRLGAEAVYFYRTTAWVDFGVGPIVRFTTPQSIYRNIIDPFDKGERPAVRPGVYPLMPPGDSRSLKRRRQYDRTTRKQRGRGHSGKTVLTHTDRIVMARDT